MKDTTLYVAVSAHGFGHLAQTAPVVNLLCRRNPTLRVIVHSTLPSEALNRHFACDFEHISESVDPGMAMDSALHVNTPRSCAAYVEFHNDLNERIRHETDRIETLHPTVVLANIPYVTLGACANLGVPTVAMCSLNWADISRPYCEHLEQADAIYAEIVGLYRRATVFLMPSPAMDMPLLPNTRQIGPVTHMGEDRRAELVDRYGLAADDKMVFISFGGIETRLAMESWPSVKGLSWVVPQAWRVKRSDVISLESLGMPYEDVLCSCDALVTKPGYGHVAGAACNGTPVLYVRRSDWPEEPFLIDWLDQNARCLEIPSSVLATGDLLPSLESLWAMAEPERPVPTGVVEAADIIQALLP